MCLSIYGWLPLGRVFGEREARGATKRSAGFMAFAAFATNHGTYTATGMYKFMQAHMDVCIDDLLISCTRNIGQRRCGCCCCCCSYHDEHQMQCVLHCRDLSILMHAYRIYIYHIYVCMWSNDKRCIFDSNPTNVRMRFTGSSRFWCSKTKSHTINICRHAHTYTCTHIYTYI